MLTTTHVMNQIPSRVLGFECPISVFSNHFLDYHITCKLTPKVLDMLTLSIFMPIIRENLIYVP